MTIEQLLSPAVWDHIYESRNIPQEKRLDEFNKWFADNIELVNESVKNNIDEINEYIERGKSKAKLSKLLIENADENHVNSDAKTKEKS
jgi:hypothetical protein